MAPTKHKMAPGQWHALVKKRRCTLMCYGVHVSLGNLNQRLSSL